MEDKASEHWTHIVKCWPEYFQALLDGTKTFEVRLNDRAYKVGDSLLLQEYDPDVEAGRNPYTGRTLHKRITYVMPGGQFGIESGYVVLSLKEVIYGR